MAVSQLKGPDEITRAIDHTEYWGYTGINSCNATSVGTPWWRTRNLAPSTGYRIRALLYYPAKVLSGTVRDIEDSNVFGPCMHYNARYEDSICFLVFYNCCQAMNPIQKSSLVSWLTYQYFSLMTLYHGRRQECSIEGATQQ